jgi:tripartite-type tricarboxylate transporter receptor subunit TctC
MPHFPLFRALCGAVLATVTALAPLAAQAQAQAAWPNKSIRMVVPFAAGTSPDIVARLVGQHLTDRLGQPVVVDNRAGAGGMLGAEAVAKSPPDGNTLFFMVNSVVTMNQFVYKKLPYDPHKDFQAVTLVAAVPYVLIANKNFQAKNLQDLIALAKAKPRTVDYASMGTGGAGHVIVELMSQLAGIELMHVPYKQGALADVIGGQVPLILQPTTTAIEQIKSGTVFGLGTTGSKRLPALPDVPAISEVVSGFEADGWQGLMAPAGTPAAVVERLNKEVADILKRPDVIERFNGLGIQPWASSPQEMQALIAKDTAKWGEVIRKARIEAQ